MIFENVELHNVTETERMPGVPGVVLRRFPRAVRDALDTRGKFVSGQSTGCEVRFVVDSPVVRVTLMAAEGDGDAVVLRGGFNHSTHKLPAGTLRTIQLESPPTLNNVQPAALDRAFRSNVWRIGFNRQDIAFISVESFGAPVRPPSKSEKPKLRWLAHGSSITHSHYETGYPHVAARMLDVDVLNTGLSGACHLEREMADFLATRTDWDLATFELGINMRGTFATEEFRARASHLIRRLAEANPGKPVGIINHFPTSASHYVEDHINAVREREYDQTLRDLVAAAKNPNLHLIEGASIFDRFDLHNVDLIHPSTVGQVRMGMNLAERLAGWVK